MATDVPRVVALSGQAASGKTTVAVALAHGLSARLLSVRQVITDLAGTGYLDRVQLQRFGADLETISVGRWLADAATAELADAVKILVVDAIRTAPQLAGLRTTFGTGLWHVHLWASVEVRERRYRARESREDRRLLFSEMSRREPGPLAEAEFQRAAQLSIDTTKLSEQAVVARVVEEARLLGCD